MSLTTSSSLNNAANAYAASQGQKAGQTGKTQETAKTGKTTGNYGKTIGNPELSEKASRTYEDLKKKYSNMDFILVSKDQIDAAKAQASSYGNANKMVVLIDEEKLERMAEDADYRKEIEGKISAAQTQMPKLQSIMQSMGNVKTVGMSFTQDNRASFFAVVDKSSKAFSEKVKQKQAEKKAEKKEAEKKAAKKEAQERLEKQREGNKTHRVEDEEGLYAMETDGDYEIITASSVEELMQKLQDYQMAGMSDSVETEAEKAVGHNVDFKV